MGPVTEVVVVPMPWELMCLCSTESPWLSEQKMQLCGEFLVIELNVGDVRFAVSRLWARVTVKLAVSEWAEMESMVASKVVGQLSVEREVDVQVDVMHVEVESKFEG